MGCVFLFFNIIKTLILKFIIAQILVFHTIEANLKTNFKFIIIIFLELAIFLIVLLFDYILK